jgi:ABC-type multidrug transport system ATPase subunit
MDEPTVGLDPDERVEFRNLLSLLGRERTIVLSTHIVADVGNTCGRVSVLAKGRMIFDGAPGDLVAKARGHVFEVEADAALEAEIHEVATVVSSVPLERGSRLRVVGQRPRAATVREVEPTLEDAYLLLVPDATAEIEDAGRAA